MKTNAPKIIRIKRKYNHAKAKRVICSWHMSGGIFLASHWGELTFKQAQAMETQNLNRYYGMGDKRNWG